MLCASIRVKHTPNRGFSDATSGECPDVQRLRLVYPDIVVWGINGPFGDWLHRAGLFVFFFPQFLNRRKTEGTEMIPPRRDSILLVFLLFNFTSIVTIFCVRFLRILGCKSSESAYCGLHGRVQEEARRCKFRSQVPPRRKFASAAASSAASRRSDSLPGTTGRSLAFAVG